MTRPKIGARVTCPGPRPSAPRETGTVAEYIETRAGTFARVRLDRTGAVITTARGLLLEITQTGDVDGATGAR
jgi:hypothetical protein